MTNAKALSKNASTALQVIDLHGRWSTDFNLWFMKICGIIKNTPVKSKLSLHAKITGYNVPSDFIFMCTKLAQLSVGSPRTLLIQNDNENMLNSSVKDFYSREVHIQKPMLTLFKTVAFSIARL